MDTDSRIIYSLTEAVSLDPASAAALCGMSNKNACQFVNKKLFHAIGQKTSSKKSSPQTHSKQEAKCRESTNNDWQWDQKKTAGRSSHFSAESGHRGQRSGGRER